jgi:hypothetical protein
LQRLRWLYGDSFFAGKHLDTHVAANLQSASVCLGALGGAARVWAADCLNPADNRARFTKAAAAFQPGMQLKTGCLLATCHVCMLWELPGILSFLRQTGPSCDPQEILITVGLRLQGKSSSLLTSSLLTDSTWVWLCGLLGATSLPRTPKVLVIFHILLRFGWFA